MTINATLLGEVIIIFALIMGALSYYFARRKTQTPILAGLLGTVLSLIPPFGLVYLVLLVLKKDVHSISAAILER